MLVLSYWSILFLVLPHFLYTQARKWEVQICLTEEYHHHILVTLNWDNGKNITCANEENCFKTEIELDNKSTPQVIGVKPSMELKAIVRNRDLHEVHGALCQTPCNAAELKLTSWTSWGIEIKRNKEYGDYEFSLGLEPYVKANVVFKPHSKETNISFFLPTEANTPSKMSLLTRGKFHLDIRVF
ncbi:uncharacterized protein LOC106880512 [Octopus bimaculoides]|uniref:Uncharacterized protein n=1 Tax=Octopus bimaculoides TaxID=37653 RepID=A0A0L8FXQ3_OCTBM|nr:uncharacterized protein LOC106880512 [Octopus bimaculoides]